MDAAKIAIEAVEMVGRLLPAFVGWVRAMIRAGKGEQEMHRDITDRTAQIEEMWGRHEAALDEKHREE